LPNETGPDPAHATQAVFAHEWTAHHPIGDDASRYRRRDARQRIQLRRGRDVNIELSLRLMPVGRATLRSAPAATFSFRAAAASSLLRARRVGCSHLVVERRLGGGGVSTGRGANDSHTGAQDSNGSNEDESFLIRL
jgi:hypothetical protein